VRRQGAAVALAAVAVAILAAGAWSAPPATTPRCFGAAARDPRHACENPSLRLSVVPSPATAKRRRNAPCTFIEHDKLIHVCAFGVPAAEAESTVALVGDSHASHWRAAVEVVALAKRWRGLSITQTSCPLSLAVRNLVEPVRFSQCARWKPQVYRWFRRHPEVSTVVVAQLSGGLGVRTRRRDKFAAAVDGYVRAWRALPRSVERIIVLRDTPKAEKYTFGCIERAIAMRRPAGTACAIPRARVLSRDPAIVAAARARSRRVRAVDLTRFFCGKRRCYPVIGGVLVNKDLTHITVVFGATLGPYLLRKINALWDSWPD
jgi:hypothetical protein